LNLLPLSTFSHKKFVMNDIVFETITVKLRPKLFHHTYLSQAEIKQNRSQLI
jgi:hypothetical protein